MKASQMITRHGLRWPCHNMNGVVPMKVTNLQTISNTMLEDNRICQGSNSRHNEGFEAPKSNCHRVGVECNLSGLAFTICEFE